jgi:hypothetical protein
MKTLRGMWGQEPDHGCIVGKHMGYQPLDASRRCRLHNQLQEEPADSSTLITIEHRESDLGLVTSLGGSDPPSHPDTSLIRYRNPNEVILSIDVPDRKIPAADPFRAMEELEGARARRQAIKISSSSPGM